MKVTVRCSQIALLLGGDPVVKMSGKNLPLLSPSPSPKRTEQKVSVKGMIQRKIWILLHVIFNWGEVKSGLSEKPSLIRGVWALEQSATPISPWLLWQAKLPEQSNSSLQFTESSVPFLNRRACLFLIAALLPIDGNLLKETSSFCFFTSIFVKY